MTSEKSDKRIGLAIIGLGRAGSIHLRDVIANWRVKLLWLVDADGKHLQKLSEEFNLQEVSLIGPEGIEAVYKDERVKAIIVSSPTFSHEHYVRGALAAGKAIFCEKPIAKTRQGIIECYDDAEKYRKPLFCSFNRRFDPAFVDLREKTKDLGDVYMVKTCSRDNPIPGKAYLETSGGIFHDCGVHDIDVICWVLGEYPTEVYVAAHAHRDEIRDMNDVDTVAITLRFPSNVLAVIDLCRMGCYGYHQTLEVLGSKGMLLAENQRPTNLQLSTESGMKVVPMEYSFPQRYAKAYVNSLNCFLDIVEGKGDFADVVATKESTVSVSIVADACEESLRTGQAVKVKY